MKSKFNLEEESNSTGIVITNTQIILNKIDIYISGEIGEPAHYVPVYQTLWDAGEKDTILIHFNTEGGNSDTAVQFRNAIQNSNAHVIGIVEGRCVSAGSMILLACDDFVVSDLSMVMVHNYHGIASGKGGELYDQISFTREWSENMIRDIYRWFLTDDEILSVMDGKDIWLNHNQARTRLERVKAKREEAAESGN